MLESIQCTYETCFCDKNKFALFNNATIYLLNRILLFSLINFHSYIYVYRAYFKIMDVYIFINNLSVTFTNSYVTIM